MRSSMYFACPGPQQAQFALNEGVTLPQLPDLGHPQGVCWPGVQAAGLLPGNEVRVGCG